MIDWIKGLTKLIFYIGFMTKHVRALDLLKHVVMFLVKLVLLWTDY